MRCTTSERCLAYAGAQSAVVLALRALTSTRPLRARAQMSHAMQVRPADTEANRPDLRKLFVGMLSKAVDESQLRAMFEPFGEIEELTILRNPVDDTSRGACARACGAVQPPRRNRVTMRRSAWPARQVAALLSTKAVRASDLLLKLSTTASR